MGLVTSLVAAPGWGQTVEATNFPPLTISEFVPQPQANLRTTKLSRAKFPVVDAHAHLGLRLRQDPEQLRGFVELMDRQQLAVCVSLDARLGAAGLDEHLSYLWSEFKDRFVVFAHLDWQGKGVADQPASWDCHQPDFARRLAWQLGQARQQGISLIQILGSSIAIQMVRSLPWMMRGSIRSGRPAVNWACPC